ncbi:MAG TPA: AAA family ATPase, partial [Terriglobales bacterium]
MNNAGEIVTAFRAMMTTGEVGALTPDQQDTQTVIAIVGRESELNHLQRLLTQTIASSGKIVFVTGEAGIGKTSIADTFLRIVRERFSSVVISRGHCIEQYGTGEAYLPFLEALGNLLTSPRRDRVAGILRTHAPTWCLQLPSVFGSSGVIEQLQRETIGASKERMQRELTDALLQFTTIAPMLLLLEDLHWADASTIDLLRHICHRISGHRLMVIGTFRAAEVESSTDHPLKGYRAEMRSRNLCEEIALSTLSRESLRVYLEERFAPNDFPGDLIALVHHKTEGHPLFATALLQYLEEGGILVWHEDRWTLSRAIEQVKLEVPETVLSMIQRQLQGLSEDDRKLLQYASVEGEEFHSTALAALIQRSDVEVEEDLARILKKHRVIGAPDEIEFPDGEIATRYRFAHALYQNVLYSEVVSKRRVALHREVASYLLARHRGEANRIAAQLARHHENGRDFVRAVECLDVAADNAISVFANAEANAHLSKAIELLSKTSEEERSSVEAALLRKRGTVRVAVSDFNGAVADFTAALESSRKANKPKAECMALIALSNALFWSHRMEEMAARVAEAEDAARRADDEGLKIEITMMIAMKHLCYGELRDAKSRLDEVIRRSSESSYTPGLNSGLAWRGALHFFQSEYASAEELLLRAHALSTQLRDSFTIMDSLFFLGLSRGNMGRM